METRPCHPKIESISKIVQRPAVFNKLENLVREMQDNELGVPVRSQKLFLTSIPAAFMGYDLIEWLMDRLSIEDSLEAVHLANLLCQFGYYFPINELKNLLVKDDSSLYRFQTPYYWPCQQHTPDNIEYAIFLAKRYLHRNRPKHSLEEYEMDAFNNLKKILSNRWDFIMSQAEDQNRRAKDRKKGDKIIMESQEKAYWRVYRPPPGYNSVVDSSPVPSRERRIKARNRTREHLKEELEFISNYSAIIRAKVSVAADGLMDHTEIFSEFDALLNSIGPSNPWVTDDPTYWCLNLPIVDIPTEKRVKKWAIGLEYLVSDKLGLQELKSYMKKEYSHENLRFWLAVQDLRTGPGSETSIKKKVKEIWEEFLSPGAKAEINIDGKTMEATKEAMKTPSRYTFETTALHVYTYLIKKDCYPRFIRSEKYQFLLANAINPGNQKKRFFNFGPVKKKINIVLPPGGSCNTSSNSVTSKIPLEDFNIHGATGEWNDLTTTGTRSGCTEEDNITPESLESHLYTRKHNSSLTRVHSKDETCPWEENTESICHVKAEEEGTCLIDRPPETNRSHSHHPHHSHSHHHHHHHHISSSESSLRSKSRSKRRKSHGGSIKSNSKSSLLLGLNSLSMYSSSDEKSHNEFERQEVSNESPLESSSSSKCTQTQGETKEPLSSLDCPSEERPIQSWTSSTEVCPWEDEANCKDSHAPFVKTYATLGYL